MSADLSNDGSYKARPHVRRWLLPGLAATCAIAWLLAAVHPLDQQAWILENLLLIVFVVVLVFAHRRLELSNTSYFLLALLSFCTSSAPITLMLRCQPDFGPETTSVSHAIIPTAWHTAPSDSCLSILSGSCFIGSAA